MKDKSETYIVDDFQYDLKKMIEKIKEAEKKRVTHTKTTRMRCFPLWKGRKSCVFKLNMV